MANGKIGQNGAIVQVFVTTGVNKLEAEFVLSQDMEGMSVLENPLWQEIVTLKFHVDVFLVHGGIGVIAQGMQNNFYIDSH